MLSSISVEHFVEEPVHLLPEIFGAALLGGSCDALGSLLPNIARVDNVHGDRDRRDKQPLRDAFALRKEAHHRRMSGS